MYPPKVADREVRAVIRELTVGTVLPSGAAVRATLASRFGSRGGVGRIYRLLAGEREPRGSPSLSAIGARLLEVENQNLREQLRELRQREELQQAYWSREVSTLAERVRGLEQRVNQAAGIGTEALSQEVQGAENRAGQLQVLLRAFGPAMRSARSDDRD